MRLQVQPIPANLSRIAAQIDLAISHRPYTSRKRNGWPVESAKPWCLTFSHCGGLVASFATLEGLERNLRARAGC